MTYNFKFLLFNKYVSKDLSYLSSNIQNFKLYKPINSSSLYLDDLRYFQFFHKLLNYRQLLHNNLVKTTNLTHPNTSKNLLLNEQDIISFKAEETKEILEEYKPRPLKKRGSKYKTKKYKKYFNGFFTKELTLDGLFIFLNKQKTKINLLKNQPIIHYFKIQPKINIMYSTTYVFYFLLLEIYKLIQLVSYLNKHFFFNLIFFIRSKCQQ